jgi:hypothetical protein
MERTDMVHSPSLIFISKYGDGKNVAYAIFCSLEMIASVVFKITYYI